MAEQELDAQSRQLRTQNKRLKDDLTFHADTTSELHKINDDLKQKILTLQREIDLNNDKETSVAKQSVNYKHRIKQLTGKIQRLQTTLNTATEEWDRIRETMTNEFTRELQIQKQFTKQSKNKCLILEKNNNILKKHSSILLGQRSELENFFYDTLNQVKDKIIQEKGFEYDEKITQYKDVLNSIGLQSENINDQTIAKDELSINPPIKPPNNYSKIKIQDLNWKQKEHILKVLIMKINMNSMETTSKLNKNQIMINKTKPNSTTDLDLTKSKTFLTQKQF